MSINIKYNEFNSAEECLIWLFKNHKDMLYYGSLHLWQEYFALDGRGVFAGSYKSVSPKDLENRIYSVIFLNNSVAIRFHDEIFVTHIPNRKYPNKTHFVKLRLPTTEIV